MNISSHYEALDAGTPLVGSWSDLLGSSAPVNLQNRLESRHPCSNTTWISLFPQLAAASGNETFRIRFVDQIWFRSNVFLSFFPWHHFGRRWSVDVAVK